MGDSPLPARRRPDKGKGVKNCVSQRLLDFPLMAWPNSLSLLDDLIRWSAQRFDHQISPSPSESPIMPRGRVGQSAIVPDKATVVGRPRVRQDAPSLGYTRDIENLIGHSLA
jgi:hypothetical protein